MDIRERFRGCLLGLAAGDAVGTTVEFRRRGTFPRVTGMVGGGPFDLAPGQWTDDTSMALCLATSLVERGGFDPRDQMERYSRWAETGYLSSTGRCFDIGGTTAAALQRFRAAGDPYAGSTDPRTAGNGCLMRLAPVPLFYYPDAAAAEQYAADSSRTTHGAAECLDACRLLARILCRALAGRPKDEVLFGSRESFVGARRIAALARGDYRDKAEEAIHGTGYVVDCLEAALWCFLRADSFEQAILLAANLGDDADTTAAVCGQVAGAYYGAAGIPAGWRERLAMRAEIERLAEALCRIPGKETVRAGYDAIAAAYLAQRRGDSPDMALLPEFVELLPTGAAVLDAGCGAGVPVTQYLSQHCRVTGVDFSAAQIELARQLVPAARFVCQDLTELNLPDGSFDGICSYYAIIHIPREEHRALFARFHGLLRPAGLALLCLGADDLPEDVEEDYLGARMYWSHYDGATNLRLLQECGFEIVWSRVVADSTSPGSAHLFVLARK